MASSAHHDEDQGLTQPLHVLLVDEDAAELKRTGIRLLEAGYVVSTRRGTVALFETIARLLPDLILLDPLMIGLDFAELSRCCRAPEWPRVALHSKVLRQVLHGAVSFKDVVGVVHKTDDDRDFLEALDELAKDVPRRLVQTPRRESPPAVSGTHLIGAVQSLPFVPRVRRG
jgi:CheY-like chemotaxis protein